MSEWHLSVKWHYEPASVLYQWLKSTEISKRQMLNHDVESFDNNCDGVAIALLESFPCF